MADASALRVAIELFHFPAKLRTLKLLPLPANTLLLLRLAIDEPEAIRESEAMSGRSREINKAAAIFFIEHVLLSPGGDSYRTLGLSPDASSNDLRAHMAILLKWLHPDVRRSENREVLTRRVLDAWDRVKTPDRRRAFDLLRRERCDAISQGLENSAKSAKSSKARRRSRLRRRKNATRRFGLFTRVLNLLSRRRPSAGPYGHGH